MTRLPRVIGASQLPLSACGCLPFVHLGADRPFPECRNAVNYNPDESSRQYSGYSSSSWRYSQLDHSSRCWIARYARAGEWMQINAGKLLAVGGVITQGRRDSDQWVTEYQVQTTKDGSTWTSVGTFSGNRDRNTKVKRMFAKPVDAKSVRFVVQKFWNGVAMRAALVVCPGPWPRRPLSAQGSPPARATP